MLTFARGGLNSRPASSHGQASVQKIAQQEAGIFRAGRTQNCDPSKEENRHVEAQIER